MNAHLGYLLRQYGSLRLSGLILIALLITMFYKLAIAVAIQKI